ncbi:MAG TPA: hypothetical protein VFH68_16060 [Polyangia bacterium]|jgi:hypothetical protein|nr:hypothetical protein [Polyangia bacterium]
MIGRWWHRRGINRYFAGALGTGGEARLRARMSRCADCRAHYRRHLVVEAALPGGETRALDRLWSGILAAGGRPVPAAALDWVTGPGAGRPPRSARGTRLALAGALAGLAILVVTGRMVSLPPRTASSDPTARGALPAVAPSPAIHLFRSVSARATEPVVGAGPIHARDGLLFAYSNPDAAFTHLMVFAVDESYAVHWYYPAYQRAGEDPAAVAILPGTTGAELGEEIRHPLRPGLLRVHALFLREPHRVLEIEALVRRTIEEPRRPLSEETPLPLPGSAQPSLLLQVAP